MSPDRRHFLLGSAALLGAASMPFGCARPPQSADVAVLGAGMAGLHAASLLREAGLEVVLLEGSDRIGGRVRSLTELPGAPEAGATEMGRSYAELLGLMQRYGIGEASLEGAYPRGYALSIGGELMSQEQWAASELSADLTEDERGAQPWRLLQRYLPRQLPAADLDGWGGPDWQQWDIPLADYLKGRGASEAALHLIAANLNAHDIRDISWTDLLRTLLIRRNSRPAGTFQVAGGLSQVAEGLGAEVGDALQLNRRIERISEAGEFIEVRCSDGSGVRARAAISTLPFSTLRRVRIDAPLSPAKVDAIRSLAYVPVTRVLFRAEEEFWLKDGLPPHLWSDAPLGRVFVSPLPGGGARAGVFAMGEAAARLDRLLAEDPAAAENLLGQLRPSTQGALRQEAAISWGANPFALGAFSHFPVGSQKRFAAAMARPEGRLAFAGEHTQLHQPGVEAALVSGRRAAGEVMQMLNVSAGTAQRSGRGL
ncbi:MAG: NAD(P)/FAD-dependent oxidoreductase [Gammaproteobacteria bacterium AqS3]|nr:NAD(P)/FAD-dependent oxidoreductase [Gammaproteobacteria bacterium AqS3]